MKVQRIGPWKVPTQAPCECGGTLRPVTLEKYDFSDYVGFKVMLHGIPGLRCDKCRGETIIGGVVNAALNLTLMKIFEHPGRLRADEAKFLRRNLGITQEELATRMGINRVTVAKWECGDEPISPQHDYVLRGTALAGFAALHSIPRETADKIIRSVFNGVRTLPPEAATIIDASSLGTMPNWPIGASSERRLSR
jgi:transcriptional regulator with XRE-family HTH domain